LQIFKKCNKTQNGVSPLTVCPKPTTCLLLFVVDIVVVVAVVVLVVVTVVVITCYCCYCGIAIKGF
jgi:hypothetical protein